MSLFVSTWRTPNVEPFEIKLPLISSGTYDFNVDWGDGTTNNITVWDQPEVKHTYEGSGIYTISISGTLIGWRFNQSFIVNDRNKLLSISSWGSINLGNEGGYFQNCINLNSLPTGLDTTGTTNFNSAFKNCTSLTSFPLIDTSNVTNLTSAWEGCRYLTSFPLIDTSNVTNFTSTWANCVDLASFPLIDTSNGTNFDRTWYNCGLTSFPQIDTSNAVSLHSTWANCRQLTSFPLINTSSVLNFTSTWAGVSLASFPLIDTSNGTNFTSTWAGVSLASFPLIDTSNALTLVSTWSNCNNLTSFPSIDTSNVTDFTGTWGSCDNLATFPIIDVSSAISLFETWANCISLTSFPEIDTSTITHFLGTWSNCTSLTSFPLIDTSNATIFSFTWSNCTSLTSFPLIDTSNVANFSNTWSNCTSLTSFPEIDTSNATNLTLTWRNCSSLISFPEIDTINVTNFSNTWGNCSSLTSFPLLNFSNGLTFTGTWAGCTNLTALPIGFGQTFGKMRFGNSCFGGVKLTNGTYSRLLKEIELTNTTNYNVSFSGGNSKYNDFGLVARNLLTSGRNWIITDGGFESDTIPISSKGIILTGFSLLPNLYEEISNGGSLSSGKAVTDQPYDIINWIGDWERIPYLDISKDFAVSLKIIDNLSIGLTTTFTIPNYPQNLPTDIAKIYNPNIINIINIYLNNNTGQLGTVFSGDYLTRTITDFIVVDVRRSNTMIDRTYKFILNESLNINISEFSSFNNRWIINPAIANENNIYAYDENEDLFYAETNVLPHPLRVETQDFDVFKNSNLSLLWQISSKDRAYFVVKLDGREIFKKTKLTFDGVFGPRTNDFWSNLIVPLIPGRHNLQLLAQSYNNDISSIKNNGVLVDKISVQTSPCIGQALPRALGYEVGWWCPSIDSLAITSGVLEDLSINNQHAILNGNTNIVLSNPLGNVNSVLINGNLQDFIEIDVNPINLFNNSFTISMQLKVNSNRDMEILTLSTSNSLNYFRLMYVPKINQSFQSTRTLQLSYYNSSNTLIHIEYEIEIDVWNYISVVVGDVNNGVKLYVNNILVNTLIGIGVSLPSIIKIRNIKIGQAVRGQVNINLDDIRLFNRPLTEDEVYKVGFSSICSFYEDEFTGGVNLSNSAIVFRNNGAALLGGRATTIYRDISSGGINLGGIGLSPYPYFENVNGGINLGGIGKSPYEYIESTSGGITVPNINVIGFKTYEEISLNGVNINGTVLDQKESHQFLIPSGISLNGSNLSNIIYNDIGDSGLNLQGISNNNIIINDNIQGAIQINGTALNREFYLSTTTSGGIALNSTSNIFINYFNQVNGGVNIEISTINTIVDFVNTFGGLLIDGQSINNTMKFFYHTALGGKETGGDYNVALRFLHKVLGELELNGDYELNIEKRFVRHFSTGSVRLNAETRINVDTYQYQPITNKIYLLGKSEYNAIYNDINCNGLLACTVKYPNKHIRCFIPSVFRSRKAKGGLDKRTKAILPAISACRQYLFLPDEE